MPKIYLSLGYDTERPYGSLARTVEGVDLRRRSVDFERKMHDFLDDEGVPRTIFILGEYLERCLDTISLDELGLLYDTTNHMREIQQHSYSHPIIRPMVDRPDKKLISIEEFVADLERANEVINNILNIRPTGLRTPIGYSRDLSDVPNLLKELVRMGILYVSSDLQDEKSLEAPLIENRQPHNYSVSGFPQIVEIPSHGWQDVVFTEEKSKLFGRTLTNPDDIVEQYINLFKIAEIMANVRSSVYISLCLHPWAIMEYDPELVVHKKIIEYANSREIQFVNYGEIAKQILNPS